MRCMPMEKVMQKVSTVSRIRKGDKRRVCEVIMMQRVNGIELETNFRPKCGSGGRVFF